MAEPWAVDSVKTDGFGEAGVPTSPAASELPFAAARRRMRTVTGSAASVALFGAFGRHVNGM